MPFEDPITEEKVFNMAPPVIIKEWPTWPNSAVHWIIEQINRIISASDVIYQRKAPGTSFSQKQFSPDSCNCPDFKKRQLPCKHVYFAAHQAGKILVKDYPDFEDKEMDYLRAYQHPSNCAPAWGGWDLRVHKTCRQVMRLERARAGTLDGSHVTTLAGCSCPDFAARQFPCKHIYFLAIQKGEIR